MEVAGSITEKTTSYRSILKSTSMIGGASVLNLVIGMFRTKFVAILLGPAGVGLIGTYTQIVSVVRTLAEMGISSSGVREVAEAVATDDEQRIARTVKTLRRTAWVTGALGALIMLLFCLPMSRMTFGNGKYSWGIAILGVTLLTQAISTGQGCIINGTRRIGDLAKMEVIGALNGTLISIPCFFMWGEGGIIPSMVLAACATLATSWWFARRVPILPVPLSWRDSVAEARQLLMLGVSFMGVGLVGTLSTYLIRVVMLRQFTLADVGIYQASFNLSGILVGFVLGAMGADYYPRLTAAAADNARVHRMVNEQSQISILLALPGLMAMMIFSPLIIRLFYSASFVTAVPILRWCILGILGRVFSFPIGYVMLAKGKGRVFFLTEIVACSFHLAAVYLCTRIWGLVGAGIAFAILYLFYTGLMLFIMRSLVGPLWDRHTILMIVGAASMMAVLMLNCTFNGNPLLTWSVNLVLFAAASYRCLRQLSEQSGVTLKALCARFGFRKSSTT